MAIIFHILEAQPQNLTINNKINLKGMIGLYLMMRRLKVILLGNRLL